MSDQDDDLPLTSLVPGVKMKSKSSGLPSKSAHKNDDHDNDDIDDDNDDEYDDADADADTDDADADADADTDDADADADTDDAVAHNDDNDDDDADDDDDNDQDQYDEHDNGDEEEEDDDDEPLIKIVPKATQTNKIPLKRQNDQDSDDDEPLTKKPTKRKQAPGSVSATAANSTKRAASKKEPNPKTKVKKEPVLASGKQTGKKRTSAKKQPSGASTKKKASDSKKVESDALVKKFEKPGQRRETPPENDPLRIFYQTMYEEKAQLGKKSDLAHNWMLIHGLLDNDSTDALVSSSTKRQMSEATLPKSEIILQ